MRKCKECSYEQDILGNSPCPRCGGTEFIVNTLKEVRTVKSSISDNTSENMRKTIKDSDFKGMGESLKESNLNNSSFKNCPRCNYLNSGQVNICPNCNYELKANASISEKQFKNTVKISEFASLDKVDNDFVVELKPVSADLETITISMIENQAHTMSRKDFDVSDESISSNPHLELNLVNGKVIIKNIATNQALFKQVNNEVVIENNDIILIGRNKFYKIVIK